MLLSPQQAERVRYLVEDCWVSDDRLKSWEDFDRALAQMSAEELHAFASKMNWDGGGAERLNRVVAHPKCDRGTALMIYWRADPAFYLKYGTREAVKTKLWPSALEEWDMMRHIEERLADTNSFATARIPYDPQNDHGRDLTKQRRKRPPFPILERRDGKFVKVGEEQQPDDPEIDVRGSLPAIVFEPVRGGQDSR